MKYVVVYDRFKLNIDEVDQYPGTCGNNCMFSFGNMNPLKTHYQKTLTVGYVLCSLQTISLSQRLTNMSTNYKLKLAVPSYICLPWAWRPYLSVTNWPTNIEVWRYPNQTNVLFNLNVWSHIVTSKYVWQTIRSIMPDHMIVNGVQC